MITVTIGGVVLGPGRPKVCVPLTGATEEALVREASSVGSAADLVELRIDRFEGLTDGNAVARAIDAVASVLDPALPVLLTCRSVGEGGGAELDAGALRALVALAAAHPGIHAVDVEMEAPGAAGAIDLVHDAGKPVVVSFHDFERTPGQAEIVDRLTRQAAMGADVVKLACTPAGPPDVLTLLGATAEYASTSGARPAITMAMGPLGVVSRVAGETFGSVLTFGTVGAASAPGQVAAVRLRGALDLIHAAQPG